MDADDEEGARDPYYIRTSAAGSDIRRLVAKCDDAFFVADQHGDFPDLAESEFGLYVGGTRFLRSLELAVHGQRPLSLSAAVAADGRRVAVDLTNPDLGHGEIVVLRGRTLRLARRLELTPTGLDQVLTVESFNPTPHELVLAWHYASDFADVFEVRGMIRERRGDLLPPAVEPGVVRLAYRGLDGVVRATTLAFTPTPEKVTAGFARHRVAIPPGEAIELRLRVSTREDDAGRAPRAAAAHAPAPAGPEPPVQVQSANAAFDAWITRAWADLSMLTTETPHGRIAYAGIPWFVAPFGRDSLITALQHLPFDPGLARGTLRFLAAYQGREDDAFTDQSPGKILHEYRRGEMAACREIVFIPYYGSVDATPLFVVLAAEYLRWTGDRAFLEELTPAIEAALGWLDRADYVTYAARSARGLVNQGWKDSHDAIMHEDGETAAGPIALVEVQGYKYAALCGAALIEEALGRPAAARARRDAAAAAAGAVHGRLLDGRRGVLCPRPRRRRRALSRDRLEPRARALERHRPARPGRPDRRAAPRPRALLRLGRAHARHARAPLQPDELPQRLGVAARHRDRGRGRPALRLHRPVPDPGDRSLRRRAAVRGPAAARAVLRLRRACRATGRRPTRWPARPRRGPPGWRRSSSSRCSDSSRRRGRTASRSRDRSCRPGCRGSRCAAFAWAARASTSTSREGARALRSRCSTVRATPSSW